MARFTLKQLLPKGPVASSREIRSGWPCPQRSGVHYEAAPRTTSPLPLIPLMPFGIAYDLDLVIVTRNPDWDMHELARLVTPDGDVWLAKDARSDTLEQSIVCGVAGLEDWLPELPVPRFAHEVLVQDRSRQGWLDLGFEWTNPRGELTRVHYEGAPPRHPQRRRNGSTMGHSRQSLIAALDLSHRTWARRVQVSYEGRPAKLHRLFGLKPFAMSLLQTQGGFVTGHFSQRALGEEHLEVIHHREGRDTQQLWERSSSDGHVTLRQTTPFRTLSYHYIGEHKAMELHEIRVSQFARPDLTMRARFSPSLPDFRTPFSGTLRSRWVLDINGQEGHALGQARISWSAEQCVMELIPESPWWVADRPMRIDICSTTERSEVRATRTT